MQTSTANETTDIAELTRLASERDATLAAVADHNEKLNAIRTEVWRYVANIAEQIHKYEGELLKLYEHFKACDDATKQLATMEAVGVATSG